MTSTAALQEKESGNIAFQNNRFEEALIHYSKAIELEDCNAVFYCNRSFTYLKLNDFESALKDALKCVSLDQQYVKGHLRAADAYFKLNKLEEAKQYFDLCLKCDPGNTYAMKGISNIENLLKNREMINFYKPFTADKPVEVKWISEKIGKGLFATRQIKQGELIFMEKPVIAQQWTRSKIQSLCCRTCLRFLGPSLWSQTKVLLDGDEQLQRFKNLPFEKECSPPLPPPVVVNEHRIYCSQRCQQKSEEIHSILYSNSSYSSVWIEHALSNKIDRFLMSGELFTRVFVDIREHGKSAEEAWGPYKHFASGSWIELISNQTSDVDTKEKLCNDLQTLLKTSHQILLQVLSERYPDVRTTGKPWQDYITLNQFDKIMGIFELNNPTIEIDSPFHFYFGKVHADKTLHKKASPVLGPLVQKINTKHNCIPSCHGHGLFYVHSCMNHSCNPNAKQTSLPTITEAEIAIEAQKEIKKGEEITISYVKSDLPKEEKLKALKQDYQIDCICKECTAKK